MNKTYGKTYPNGTIYTRQSPYTYYSDFYNESAYTGKTTVYFEYDERDRVDELTSIVARANREYNRLRTYNSQTKTYNESVNDTLIRTRDVLREAYSELNYHYDVYFNEYANNMAFIDSAEKYIRCITESDDGGDEGKKKGIIRTIIDGVKKFFSKIINIFKSDNKKKLEAALKEIGDKLQEDPKLNNVIVQYEDKDGPHSDKAGELYRKLKAANNKKDAELAGQLNEFLKSANANEDSEKTKSLAGRVMAKAKGTISNHTSAIKKLAIAIGVGGAALAGTKVASDAIKKSTTKPSPEIMKDIEKHASDLEDYMKYMANVKNDENRKGISRVFGKKTKYSSQQIKQFEQKNAAVNNFLKNKNLRGSDKRYFANLRKYYDSLYSNDKDPAQKDEREALMKKIDKYQKDNGLGSI